MNNAYQGKLVKLLRKYIKLIKLLNELEPVLKS